MRFRSLILVMLAAITTLPACRGASHKGMEPSPQTSSSRTPSLDPGQPWPYLPVGIRVHPLSRIVHDVDGMATVLEARVEFVDRDGDTTKAIGWLELRMAPSPTATPVGSTWDCDLSDLETNRLHYDVVTRTYLLKLRLTPDDIPTELTLVASLTTPEGDMLEDRKPIRMKSPDS